MPKAEEIRRLETETFMHFAFGIWPQISDSFAAEMQKRCWGCILPESFAELDAKGYCKACLLKASPAAHNYQPEKKDLTKELDELLQKASGAARGSYDAVLLFSGGKDSMYLAHRLLSEYPRLRFLPLLIDNGFMSEVALDNAYYGCRKMGLELMRFTPPPILFEKTFRHAFLHLAEKSCYEVVDRMDGDLVFDIGRRVAATVGAPLLLAGLSVEQIEMILGMDHFESPAAVEQQGRTHSAGFSLSELFDPSELERYWWSPGERDRARVIFPFFAWRPAEKDIVKQVKKLRLIPRGQDNPLITNNHTIPLMLAADYARLGYSGFEPEFAEMVRLGKSERQDWLPLFQAMEFLVQRGEFLPQSMDQTLRRLGLQPKDLGLPVLQLDSSLIEKYACVTSF